MATKKKAVRKGAGKKVPPSAGASRRIWINIYSDSDAYVHWTAEDAKIGLCSDGITLAGLVREAKPVKE